MDFAEFWEIYPRKVSRKDALKFWLRLDQGSQEAAMASLPRHVELWTLEGRDKTYIPHAASWLNGARWEDEIDLPKPKADSTWRKSEEGIMGEGRRKGMLPKPGESLWDYRSRLESA